MPISLRLLAVVSLLLPLAGCDDVTTTTSFQTSGVASSAAVARNEAIEIQFTQRLDEFDVPSDAVRVSDAAGRVVPVKLSARQRNLRIEAQSAAGWPAGAELSITLPYPPLGRPLRSRDGVALGRPFSAAVRTQAGYLPRSGELRVTPRGFLPGMREVTQDAVFQFDFDGAVDPDSLADAVRLVDLATGSSRTVAARADGPERIAVAPFADGGFAGGAGYRLEFSKTLRALDGRRPPVAAGWPFTTARGITGEHITLFRPEDLEEPSLKPGRGPLVPVKRTSIASVVHDLRETSPFVLGAGAFRLQVVVPAAAFGGDDALVERILVPVVAPPGAATVVAGLEVRLGPFGAGDELGSSFEENCRGYAPPQPLYEALSGAVALRVEADGRVELRFAAPYLHRATDASGMPQGLLVDLAVGPGVASDAPLLAIRGERSADSGRRCFAAEAADAPEGRASDVVAGLEIVAVQYTPIALKPWSTDLKSPRYFDRADVVVARGRPFEDFTVEYRALTPSGFGGNPVDATPWSPRLSALHGAQVVQARIVFHPRPDRPGQPPPEIERLSLPFKSDG